MLNIGENPTFANKTWSVEVHLFDFDKEIYGEMVTIDFVNKTRDEIRFTKAGDLAKQLKIDEREIRAILEI